MNADTEAVITIRLCNNLVYFSFLSLGFPQHTIASLSDLDAKPSFSMA